MNKLYPNEFYHIYNRGNNGENLFHRQKNYEYFLEKYRLHLSEYVNTYAFCLMPNHFHLLIEVKDLEKNNKDLTGFQNLSGLVSKKFSNFFNGYTKAINKQQNRHGNLFERPFKRKHIKEDSHLLQLIYYIHNNPIRHGFVKNMKEWEFSSYNEILNPKNTKSETISFFGGIDNYIDFHNKDTEPDKISDLILE